MSTRPFRFDPEKGLEVLLYIASHLNEDFYRVLKALYFADKKHLENYGRLICGDHYIAMKSGVVPSGLYDYVKDVREPDRPPSHGIDAREAFDLNGFRIVPKRDPKLEYLSKSDIECLDQAISDIPKMDWKTFYNATHGEDYEAADRDDEIPFDAVVRTLPNGELLLESLRS
jgi:hypothetical protein